MTAEVYVCNKTCIALAADSASSIGKDRLKIYNGVEKLFPLSRKYPVGIMIFGLASFMRMPWESIIKQYRNRNGGDSYNTTKEYAQAFLEQLEALSLSNMTDDDEKHYIQGRLDTLMETVICVLDRSLADWIDIPIPESEKKISVICEGLRKYADKDQIQGAPVDIFKETYKSFIVERLTKIFDSSAKKDYLTEQTLEQLINSVIALYFDKKNSDHTSGIVISGFGEDEIFPSCYSYRLAGTINRSLLCWDHHSDEPNGLSRIIPFAQDEMAHSFLMGLSPDASQNIISMLDGITDDFIMAVSMAGLEDDQLQSLKTIAKECINNRHDDFRKSQTEHHPKKIMDMLSHLPKEEMAQLAETLVSLTALKQRITDSDETVGGPIDVAVISKGDGFIWMKRKHYFDPAINRDYTLRTRL